MTTKHRTWAKWTWRSPVKPASLGPLNRRTFTHSPTSAISQTTLPSRAQPWQALRTTVEVLWPPYKRRSCRGVTPINRIWRWSIAWFPNAKVKWASRLGGCFWVFEWCTCNYFDRNNWVKWSIYRENVNFSLCLCDTRSDFTF